MHVEQYPGEVADQEEEDDAEQDGRQVHLARLLTVAAGGAARLPGGGASPVVRVQVCVCTMYMHMKISASLLYYSKGRLICLKQNIATSAVYNFSLGLHASANRDYIAIISGLYCK